MKKNLILLTGPSTAGKTTLLKLLFEVQKNNTFFPLVQVTSRSKRDDDDPRFIRHYKEDIFDKLPFWIRHKQYGVTQSDIQSFLSSSSQTAIGIVGVYELMQAKEKKSDDLDVKSVLIKMTDNQRVEEDLVIENIKHFFQNPELRIEQNRRHLAAFFLNPTFNDRYVDLTLTRNKDIESWLFDLANQFNIPQLKEVKKDRTQKIFSELIRLRVESR